MSPRARKPKCSSGKAAFPTQGKALRALQLRVMEDAQAAVPTDVVMTGVYQCVECRWWHLTKQDWRPGTVPAPWKPGGLVA